MPKASVTSASALWFLVGPFDSEETVQHLPIYTSPFLIGRRRICRCRCLARRFPMYTLK